METLAGSFSFCGDSPFDLGICAGLASGVRRTDGTLCAFDGGGHPDHVDDLLFGRMERSGRGSNQSTF